MIRERILTSFDTSVGFLDFRGFKRRLRRKEIHQAKKNRLAHKEAVEKAGINSLEIGGFIEIHTCVVGIDFK